MFLIQKWMDRSTIQYIELLRLVPMSIFNHIKISIMKNILPFLLLIGTLWSCNDEYLEKVPKDSVSDIQYWKTAEDIKLYANQFYPDLRPAHYNWRADNNTDNNVPADRNSYVWGESVIPASGGGWGKDNWLGIRRCNYGLVRISDLERDPEILKYEAELRFFRAFYYFNKVKQFGDVPWIDQDLQIDSEELQKG